MRYRFKKYCMFFKNHYVFVNLPLVSGLEKYVETQNYNCLLKRFCFRNKSLDLEENCEITTEYP